MKYATKASQIKIRGMIFLRVSFTFPSGFPNLYPSSYSLPYSLLFFCLCPNFPWSRSHYITPSRTSRVKILFSAFQYKRCSNVQDGRETKQKWVLKRKQYLKIIKRASEQPKPIGDNNMLGTITTPTECCSRGGGYCEAMSARCWTRSGISDITIYMVISAERLTAFNTKHTVLMCNLQEMLKREIWTKKYKENEKGETYYERMSKIRKKEEDENQKKTKRSWERGLEMKGNNKTWDSNIDIALRKVV